MRKDVFELRKGHSLGTPEYRSTSRLNYVMQLFSTTYLAFMLSQSSPLSQKTERRNSYVDFLMKRSIAEATKSIFLNAQLMNCKSKGYFYNGKMFNNKYFLEKDAGRDMWILVPSVDMYR